MRTLISPTAARQRGNTEDVGILSGTRGSANQEACVLWSIPGYGKPGSVASVASTRAKTSAWQAAYSGGRAHRAVIMLRSHARQECGGMLRRGAC